MTRRILVLSALALAGLQAGARAQTIVNSGDFCISGASDGVSYSWWIDLDNDNNDIEAEWRNLSAPAVAAGGGADDLATAFADSINNGCQVPGECTEVLPGTFQCTAGGSNQLGLPCAGPTQCTGDLVPCPEATAAGSCFTLDVDVGAGGFSLRVGDAGLTPDCEVTVAGCDYNPTIVQVLPPQIPALGPWGLTLLAALLIGSGAWLFRRRRASAHP